MLAVIAWYCGWIPSIGAICIARPGLLPCCHKAWPAKEVKSGVSWLNGLLPDGLHSRLERQRFGDVDVREHLRQQRPQLLADGGLQVGAGVPDFA